MEIPKRTHIIETPIAINWLDENGVLCSVSKNVPNTISNFETHFNQLEALIENKITPFLIDPTNAQGLKPKDRKVLHDRVVIDYELRRHLFRIDQ